MRLGGQTDCKDSSPQRGRKRPVTYAVQAQLRREPGTHSESLLMEPNRKRKISGCGHLLLPLNSCRGWRGSLECISCFLVCPMPVPRDWWSLPQEPFRRSLAFLGSVSRQTMEYVVPLRSSYLRSRLSPQEAGGCLTIFGDLCFL